MQHSSLALHSEIKEQITHGLLNFSTIVQQKPDYIRIIHPLCGITSIKLIEGEPARFSHLVIGNPRKTLNEFGCQFKVEHRAFYHKPMVVRHSFRFSTLLSKAPAHFDKCEVAGYLVKGAKLKSKNKTRMPRKL